MHKLDFLSNVRTFNFTVKLLMLLRLKFMFFFRASRKM